MRRLTIPNQVILRLARSDFPPLFHALHQSIGGGDGLWAVVLWGYDRALCEDLQQIWQQFLPQQPTKAFPGSEQSFEAASSNQAEALGSGQNGTRFEKFPQSCLNLTRILSCSEALTDGEDGFFVPSTQTGAVSSQMLSEKVVYLPELAAEARAISGSKTIANLLFLASSLQVWIQVEPESTFDSSESRNSSSNHQIGESDRPWQVSLSFDLEAVAKLLAIPAIAPFVPAHTGSFKQNPLSNAALQSFWVNLLQLPQPPPEKQPPASPSTFPQPISADSLSNQAPIGILYLALDGGIASANPAFCRLIGYTEAQLQSLDNRTISDPEDFAAEVRLIQQLVDVGQRQQTLRKRYLRADGYLLWTEVNLSLVGDFEAGEGLILAFVTDLSDRKRAEQEIRQSREREALLNDISAQIRIKLDLQTILQATVERLRRALNSDRVIAYQFFPDYSGVCIAEDVALVYPTMKGQQFPDECIPLAHLDAYQRGRLWSIADIHTSELPKCFQEMLNQFEVHSLMATAVVSMDEALEPHNRTLWGLLVVHHCRGSRQWTADEQQLLRSVANLIAAALEQTRLLHQLQIQTDELEDREHEQRLSAEHFRSFLEKSTDIFVEYDSELRYISINPAGCEFLRLPPDKIIGKTNRELLGSSGESIESLIQRAFDTGTKVFVDHELSLVDGTRIFETVYAPIANSSGTVQRVIGICRDVTEFKRHWQLLETQNHQLTETTRLKEEFVATTSHELRTPLTAILGFSNVLLQEFFGELNPKQKDYLERIHTSGQHLLDLINDILDLSRLEADRLELDFQTIFVPDICEGVISLIHERAINQGLRLEVDLDPHVDWMVADPRRLKQMLLNLLTNAVKFTQEGSVGLKVYHQPDLVSRPPYESPYHLSGQPHSIPPGTVHFLIWDTGIGIDESDQKLLFSPFAQIDSSLSRKHQGTGLGLVITRKLAELHGGTITLESSHEQGARFTISLPMQGGR